MEKEEIVDKFVEEVKNIAEQWTRKIAEGEDPNYKYTDEIFHLHNVLKKIIKDLPIDD